MTKHLPMPDQALLHERFIYSCVEGVLYWRYNNSPAVDLFKPAGCSTYGYHIINLKGKCYRRSRLVWAFHNSDPGELEIDHINRLKTDDRIENLRLATRAQNARSQTMKRNNCTGYRGVYWNKNRNKYQSQIRDKEGKRVYLGLYALPEDAAAAYAAASIIYHGEFAGDLQ